MYDQIKSILEDNGYPITEGRNYISTQALFRGGDNKTSICIYPADNLVIDFVTGERFNLKEFISRVLNIKNTEDLESFLKENSLNFSTGPKVIQEKLISSQAKLDKDFLDKLEPIHDYWTKRGICESLLTKFQGGVYNGRYHFPIFSGNNLVGITSRDLTNKSKVKWLHKGKKSTWIWPAHEDIEIKKSVFLVESVGCALSLMTCGINNVLVVFGADCSYDIINYLLKIRGIEINISLNSDERGKEGVFKTMGKLRKYFDRDKINVVLPIGYKDWNDMLLAKSGKELILKQLNDLTNKAYLL